MTTPHDSGPNVGPATGSFLKTLGDMSFTKFITTRFIRILYIIGIAFIVLNFVASVFLDASGALLVSSSSDVWGRTSTNGYSDYYNDYYGESYQSSSGGQVSALRVLIGAIVYAVAAFLQICILRISLEVAHAVVRTAEAWARIKKRADAGTVSL